MELLDKLNWRYATKAMNGKTVDEDKIDRILEAARLAPTSSGLQPFEIIVITNNDIKEQIKPVAWDQSVITDSSHLLVFAAWDTYTAERINQVFDMTNSVRGYENEGFENYRQMLLNTYPQKDAEENFIHASKQAYIAFGLAVAAAACVPTLSFLALTLPLLRAVREQKCNDLVAIIFLTPSHTHSTNYYITRYILSLIHI